MSASLQIVVDNKTYTLVENKLQAYAWFNSSLEQLGPSFVTQEQALNWAKMMVRISWAGRAVIIERYKSGIDS